MFRARHEGSTKCHTASRSCVRASSRAARITLKSPACTPLHLARTLQINQVSWACSVTPQKAGIALSAHCCWLPTKGQSVSRLSIFNTTRHMAHKTLNSIDVPSFVIPRTTLPRTSDHIRITCCSICTAAHGFHTSEADGACFSGQEAHLVLVRLALKLLLCTRAARVFHDRRQVPVSLPALHDRHRRTCVRVKGAQFLSRAARATK